MLKLKSYPAYMLLFILSLLILSCGGGEGNSSSSSSGGSGSGGTPNTFGGGSPVQVGDGGNRLQNDGPLHYTVDIPIGYFPRAGVELGYCLGKCTPAIHERTFQGNTYRVVFANPDGGENPLVYQGHLQYKDRPYDFDFPDDTPNYNRNLNLHIEPSNIIIRNDRQQVLDSLNLNYSEVTKYSYQDITTAYEIRDQDFPNLFASIYSDIKSDGSPNPLRPDFLAGGSGVYDIPRGEFTYTGTVAESHRTLGDRIYFGEFTMTINFTDRNNWGYMSLSPSAPTGTIETRIDVGGFESRLSGDIDVDLRTGAIREDPLGGGLNYTIRDTNISGAGYGLDDGYSYDGEVSFKGNLHSQHAQGVTGVYYSKFNDLNNIYPDSSVSDGHAYGGVLVGGRSDLRE